MSNKQEIAIKELQGRLRIMCTLMIAVLSRNGIPEVSVNESQALALNENYESEAELATDGDEEILYTFRITRKVVDLSYNSVVESIQSQGE